MILLEPRMSEWLRWGSFHSCLFTHALVTIAGVIRGSTNRPLSHRGFASGV